MENPEIKLLSMASNSVVVQTPYRRFPGIIIQGDTLHTWYCLLEECQKCVAASDIDEASQCISELRSKIQAHLIHYERVLKEIDLKLPYGGSVTDT